MEEVFNCLEEIISSIKNSKEYKNCLLLKEKMNQNEEITTLIEKIKKCQKKYVQSNYDSKYEKELKELEKSLEQIPIYTIYLDNLAKVNEKIEYVKDSLNDYFYQLLNKKY